MSQRKLLRSSRQISVWKRRNDSDDRSHAIYSIFQQSKQAKYIRINILNMKKMLFTVYVQRVCVMCVSVVKEKKTDDKRVTQHHQN